MYQNKVDSKPQKIAINDIKQSEHYTELRNKIKQPNNEPKNKLLSNPAAFKINCC